MKLPALPLLLGLSALGCLLPRCSAPPDLLTGEPTKAQTAAHTEASVKPGINKPFLDPALDVEAFTKRFEGESREISVERSRILSAMEIEPGMELADIGAGTGLFTGLMAQATGDRGKVYAVDIATPFLEQIQRRAEEQKLSQVETVLCKEDSVELAADSVDLAFICDVYHHFEYPHSTLASIFLALRKGGRMLVIDFERIPGQSSDWVLGHVRAGKQTTRTEIEAAGFLFEEELQIDGLRENYVLRFLKP